MTDSSIYTDESLDEEMKGTDQRWYSGLENKQQRDEKIRMQDEKNTLRPNKKPTNDSTEQYK